jgi:uncharacterized MAPEG superfamily protein
VVVLPIIAKLPVALEMNKLGGYNNRHPRAQQNELKGFGARALAAHKNSFEAIAYFAPAAITVLALGAVDQTAIYLALAFVVCRVAYIVFYLLNSDKLRSLFWLIGFGCAVTMLARLLWAFG